MKRKYSDVLTLIKKYTTRPALFEPGEPRFWDDPHISKGMLEAHLNPNNDLASRKHKTIDKEVNSLISSGIIKPGDRLLDLGCGPGLYASRLAAKGIKVTGVDISKRSLNYAMAQARKINLDIEYRLLNFFDLDYTGEFDAAIQIEGEIGTFSDERRDNLLARLHHVLKPGGLLVFDVNTPFLTTPPCPLYHWAIRDGGFWRPGCHLTLDMRFDYPENNVYVDQYIVADKDKIAVYRIWNHTYTPDSIKPVLVKSGFHIEHTWNDFCGTPYRAGGEWLAIVARSS